ncbi:MAG: NTP transferase domain-containing protein [Acidimicrobiaceae bacterium]|nr:NTP transferase domain-containing protein [Acidimicrobiaceae bacterium]
MRPMTETMPKALVPVLGAPFAEWQLRHLAGQGAERVVYSIGYRGEMLREHIGDGSRFGLSVTWVDEGLQLRGTGGALRLALDLDVLDEAFFVLYGDSYLPASMGRVERGWRASRAPALMAVMRNEGRWDASNVVYSEGRVVLYDKRRPERWRSRMRWIDYGLTILTRQVLADGLESGAQADLADLLRELSRSGRLAGVEVAERFYEAGSKEGLRDLESFLSGTVSRSG